jgi:2-polyprenyl-6-methoxyphenol hydroxylase-like FAD-dependent oxidoreductase
MCCLFYDPSHRQDMHAIFLSAATSPEGEGPPAELFCLAGAQSIDFDSTTVTFSDGKVKQFDMVIGADGVVVSFPQFPEARQEPRVPC